jgi:hypothetical protein
MDDYEGPGAILFVLALVAAVGVLALLGHSMWWLFGH